MVPQSWNMSTNSPQSDESDAEKEEVKQEEGDKASQDQDAANASKTDGSTSSKPKALTDKKGKSLKRPGSPNLSEMESSGNESSRKRVKKQATGSVRGSRASTPMSSSQRSKAVTGVMSDGEATGGEMSDAGRTKKKAPRVMVMSGSHGKGTPSSSRAGSPAPASGQASPGMCLPYPTFNFGSVLLKLSISRFSIAISPRA